MNMNRLSFCAVLLAPTLALAADAPKDDAMARNGGVTHHNKGLYHYLASQGWVDPKRDKDYIESIYKKSGDYDVAIKAWIGQHKVSEKVAKAARAGEPAPGMPRELLDLIGVFERKTATEHEESGRFFIHGWNVGVWNIVITDDVVSVVHVPEPTEENLVTKP